VKKTFHVLIPCLIIAAMIIGCSGADSDEPVVESGLDTTQTAYSHSDDTAPDYAVVLPDDQVNEITITISPENWQAVIDDMSSRYGEFGSSQGMGGRPGGEADGQRGGGGPQMQNPPEEIDGMDGEIPAMGTPPADLTAGQPAAPDAQENGDFAPADDAGLERLQMEGAGPGVKGGRGQGMGGAIMDGDDDENPVWVDATITFNAESWEHVGFRLKGNSSLRSSWNSGSYKLPFKLDFDQFEDDYSETRNQRFYGFKQLSFSSNFSDSSYLRETLSADIFRAAGVPSPQTAFYVVYVDYGSGPVYFGLYTAVEVVDDTLIQAQFADDSGNVYKPSGSAATFAVGTYDEEQYDKQTNEKDADYSDVKALMETLNSDQRLTDAEAWRAELEEIFDVDNFLRWLAANSIMSNWDTYGSMAHNYYLYHDPISDQLVWIPWDNNQSISSRGNGKDGGGGGRAPMNAGSSSIGNENAGDNWPLISYLLADGVYRQQYIDAVEDVAADAFNPDDLEAQITRLHELIASYVEAETDGYTTLSDKGSFETSAESLIELIRTRYQAAQDYLAQYK